MNNHPTQNQRGNVLLYILVAVALIAALSLAISSSMRGNTAQIDEDRAEIIAGELIEYSGIMANAVAQLRLRGVLESQLCFDHTSWGAADYNHAGCTDNINRIYHPSGAGLTWTAAQSQAMDTSATPDNLWHIYSDNEVQGIGTTCGAAACSELILIVDELDQTVCEKINDFLGVPNPSSTVPTDTEIGETRYTGTFGYTETIGDTVGSADLDGRVSGCFQRSAIPEYVFYKVLIAR